MARQRHKGFVVALSECGNLRRTQYVRIDAEVLQAAVQRPMRRSVAPQEGHPGAHLALRQGRAIRIRPFDVIEIEPPLSSRTAARRRRPGA